MSANGSSVNRSRIQELETELVKVKDTLKNIDRAIADLQGDAADNPDRMDDGDLADRFNDEGGRKRIMEDRLAAIERELATLR